MERVCLQRRSKVLGVNANYELVDLEAVWAADDGTVGMLFTFEVSWVQVSIRTRQKNSYGMYFARPSFQASIGVAMIQSLMLLAGFWVLDLGF